MYSNLYLGLCICVLKFLSRSYCYISWCLCFECKDFNLFWKIETTTHHYTQPCFNHHKQFLLQHQQLYCNPPRYSPKHTQNTTCPGERQWHPLLLLSWLSICTSASTVACWASRIWQALPWNCPLRILWGQVVCSSKSGNGQCEESSCLIVLTLLGTPWAPHLWKWAYLAWQPRISTIQSINATIHWFAHMHKHKGCAIVPRAPFFMHTQTHKDSKFTHTHV